MASAFWAVAATVQSTSIDLRLRRRDIDPEMNKLDGIFVYDIDDLQQVVSSHVASRRVEADHAEAIVQLEVDKFQARLQTLDVVPTILSLQEHLETVRQAVAVFRPPGQPQS